MSKSNKTPLDMAGLLATKGQGTPANDAPARLAVARSRTDEQTTRRISEKTPSREFVNLGFKVPREFRHRLRKIAAERDISLVEVLRQAINLYEQKRP
jgi:hypothetical protein